MSNKISNKDAEMYRRIVEDFNEKPDHETELATVKNLGLLIAALHCLNVLAFCAIVEYFHFQNFLKIIALCLIAVIGIALESLKRKRAFMYAQTMVLAEHHPDNGVRERAYKRSKGQFPMLGITWAIAVVVAIFSGIGMAHFLIPEIAQASQNPQYENAWKSNIQALDAATKESAPLSKIKMLQSAVEKAKQDYELDKKNVATYNAEKREAHISEISVYALLGGGIGLALECCLFLAIWGYFKKKYDIALSLQQAQAEAQKQAEAQSQSQAQGVDPNANRQAPQA